MILATLLAALTITVWPEGMDGPHRTWTLRCSPVGGTLPGRVDACTRLARLQSPFAPTPKNVACTEIYGGPQVALVRGTYRGRRIWVRFARRDGCEIERWNRHRFLLPGGVGSVR